MSLQAILDAILAQGAERVRQIEQAASQQAGALLQKAQAEGEAQRERLIAQCRGRALQEQTRRLQQTNQQCALIVSAAREELVDEALARVGERLQTARQDADYGVVLLRLAEEALDTLRPSLRKGEVPILQADPVDQALLAALPGRVTVAYTLRCLGGVVARSEDGRVIVVNTLEARLEQATPYLRRYLARSFEARAMAYV